MDRLVSLAERIALQSSFNPESTDIDPALTARRVWIPDNVEGFYPGWIKSQSGDEGNPNATAEVVIALTGEVRQVPLYLLSPMNPPQFDGVEDIADLTHLNEASVINNLRMRYGGGSIYVSFSSHCLNSQC